MARIAFLPHPQMGHINPTVKLARALKRQGHDVSYFCLADLEEYLASQGLGFVPILTESIPKGSMVQQARMKLDWAALWDGVIQGSVNPLVEVATALMAARPDLLLIDFLLRDLVLIARKLGIPCALLSTSLEDARFRLVETSFDDPADELPTLILCPREFDDPHAICPQGRCYVEASIDLERREPGGFSWEALDATRPLIFCTLGSHSEDYKESGAFFRAVIDAMREKPGWQLLLALGNPLVDPADLQPVPPNVVLVSWAPQLAVLARASLMMTHGGLGTIKECIFFGVPMIVFPVAWDQPGNAARVEAHGLGVQGKIDEVSAPQILHLIERVESDPAMRRRAQAMSEVFRKIEDSEIGVRAVGKILDAVQRTGKVPSALPQSL